MTSTTTPRTTTARERLVAGLRSVFVDGQPVVKVSPKLMAGLSSSDRRWLKDRLFGIAVWRRPLSLSTGLAMSDDGRLPRLSDIEVDDLCVAFAGDVDDVDAIDLRNAGRRAAIHSAVAEALGMVASTNDAVASALVSSLGLPGARAFLAASATPGPRTLRANTLVGDRDALMARLADGGISSVSNTGSPWAVDVVGPANLTGSAAFRAGAFEVQDASSQAVVVAANARPGEVVVDLCAGRGGKTLALGASMENVGEIWVNDVDDAALKDLRGRLGRSGLSIVREGLPPVGSADLVVVDAPCSSVGVLRRSPDLRFAFDPRTLRTLTVLQEALLVQGASLLKPGGRLLYATCSVLREENEEAVSTVTLSPALKLRCAQTANLGPATTGGDGFYWALLSPQ